jgi:hypothetical protein
LKLVLATSGGGRIEIDLAGGTSGGGRIEIDLVE